MNEREIEATLKRGFPLPRKQVLDALLKQCIANLNAGDVSDAPESDEQMELDDEQLDMLAAAGEVFAADFERR